MTASLRVELGARSYDIVIGESVLKDAGKHLAALLPQPRVIIITDTNVAKLHLKSLELSLDTYGIAHSHIILPAGEQTKSFEQFHSLLNALLERRPDRSTTLIAFGGGVIGDITGFAASVLLRGVHFVQIPTTLLAQVDSSVGGKTGINTAYGKNLVGTFYQPTLVLADIDTLLTLPKRELLAGYAEVVKYGVINDYPFFAWLEEHGAKALAGDKKALAHCVLESCKAKADIVGKDERESGLRALLNFGHTFAHALEAETGYSDTLLHGEAVAIGMVMAMHFSVRKDLCSPEDMTRVEQLLKAAGLSVSPLEIRAKWDANKLINHFYHDKKTVNGELTFILAEKIGKTAIYHDIKAEELKGLLAEIL